MECLRTEKEELELNSYDGECMVHGAMPDTPPKFSMPMARRAKQILVVATVIVDALAPLLQEQASKRAGFESSSMVLAETMSYYLGGLLLAILTYGSDGIHICVRPARYLAFLPASFAFSTSNFLTYVAVRGLGASQFYLLAQLRLAILALVHRWRTGIQQPLVAWLSLVQLAFGMVVLVWYKSTDAGGDCSFPGASAASAANSAASVGVASRASQAHAEGVASEHAAFVAGIFALVGVVLTSAFGFVYLEWQLKLHASDPLFVQLHHMNSFGALAALLIHLNHHHDEALPGVSVAQSDAALAGIVNASFAMAPTAASVMPEEVQEGTSFLEVAILLSCIIGRGVLSGSVLKQLDTIAKGLIDVTAIVLCTCLQIWIDPASANGTSVGLQFLMLLSIVSFQQARTQVDRALELPAGAALAIAGTRSANPKAC
mmetsp:Transcript_90224/g.291711  ORF Transcript_90224/g.291711 Transcript_90224/m.291711 type:complete len:432 (+) Transcript_90224:96-1391(+)